MSKPEEVEAPRPSRYIPGLLPVAIILAAVIYAAANIALLDRLESFDWKPVILQEPGEVRSAIFRREQDLSLLMLVHPVVALGLVLWAWSVNNKRRATSGCLLLLGATVVASGFLNWSRLWYFALIGID